MLQEREIKFRVDVILVNEFMLLQVGNTYLSPPQQIYDVNSEAARACFGRVWLKKKK